MTLIVKGLKGVEHAILDSTAHLSKVLGRFEDILVTFLKAQEAREQAPGTQENKEEETKDGEENKGGDDAEVVVKESAASEKEKVEVENTSDE